MGEILHIYISRGWDGSSNKKGGELLDWVKEAEKLKFDDGKSWTEVARAINKYFPELNEQQMFEKVRGRLRQTDRYKTKGKITYENKRQPTEQDVMNLYEQMKKTNRAIMNLESKQNKADIHLDDNKPIGVAFWGDWHVGAKGADYERFDKDTEVIKNTDGLYVIGMGDYKDNSNAFIHPTSTQEDIITTNTQRNFVNEFGHCDIVAVAHKHFCEMHHTRRMGEETIYLRSGTYKRYDEFGQKLAGYEGMYGVPVVILFPDRKEMIPIKSLETAAEMLKDLRK